MRPQQLLQLLSVASCGLGAPTTSHDNRKARLPTRLIGLEEHVIFKALPYEYVADPTINALLHDVGSTRLHNMDAGHVSMQILASQPNLTATNPDGCVAANNELAGIIRQHPTRYRGFAGLPMEYPLQAAAELKRAVTQLGLQGAMIDNHLPNGSYYDDEAYWPVFAMAQELDVPLYLHPTYPSVEDTGLHYAGDWSVPTTIKLGSATFGWHEDTGLHILRLYTAGLFLQYPKLKIIIGHDGETLPMMLDRIDDPGHQVRTDQKITDVWDNNIWVTTGGFFHLRTFEMLMKVTKPERVMYSVDYPYGNTTVGWGFVQQLAQSGLFTDEQMNDFAYGTAEKLLKLRGKH